VKIFEPIFIRKTEKRGYQITGSVPGYGTITRYGSSEEEAKEKFFQACNGMQNRTPSPRSEAHFGAMGRA
jgi:hypothetical protein